MQDQKHDADDEHYQKTFSKGRTTHLKSFFFQTQKVLELEATIKDSRAYQTFADEGLADGMEIRNHRGFAYERLALVEVLDEESLC